MAVEDHRMLFVKAEVAELQKVNPKLRFAQAWELVRKKHPDRVRRFAGNRQQGRRGCSLCGWNKAGLNYLIISELSEAEMEKSEDLLREQTD